MMVALASHRRSTSLSFVCVPAPLRSPQGRRSLAVGVACLLDTTLWQHLALSVGPDADPRDRSQTDTRVPRLGMMLVGLGGNNGSTLTAGILANKHGLSWRTKTGEQAANYWGSISQASTVLLGNDRAGREVFAPLKSFLPMVEPNDLVVGGWDISSDNLYSAVVRAQVRLPKRP